MRFSRFSGKNFNFFKKQKPFVWVDPLKHPMVKKYFDWMNGYEYFTDKKSGVILHDIPKTQMLKEVRKYLIYLLSEDLYTHTHPRDRYYWKADSYYYTNYKSEDCIVGSFYR